ncbi:hypothetical protein JMJ35_006963 [Cladonia borealis]|uniref:20S-pre-rRNA D-site endonuclease NOB1 n=1 Tax=Cladonia borealis TaxID=184061 RepID=A0AA39QZ87_9LECA|nr:hypothetical protein JMJ35_006963 [Cladonia borealis]
MTSTKKPVHTIILDAGPIIKNEPSVSVLVSKCENLVTVPSVIGEIKDIQARSRLEITLLPFLTVISPKPESAKFVVEFSRRTGDLPVLSQSDIQILALAYELECNQNGGDCRLRKVPGQKRVNGSPPKLQKDSLGEAETASEHQPSSDVPVDPLTTEPTTAVQDAAGDQKLNETVPEDANVVVEAMSDLKLETLKPEPGSTSDLSPHGNDALPEVDEIGSNSESSDSEGWITPSNLKKQQAKDQDASTVPISEDQIIQVATITTDFAMQNVLLQIGLNLLSPSMQRVRNIRTYILRCHACFEKVKDMNKQFCPRCGNPTLTRVSCSTNSKGEFKIHLKKNMQWNHRGDRYSIPKPVPGTSNGKVGKGKGGGKGGWGQSLILAEDQKEYQRAINSRSRKKETDLMDEDYLPGILTGERGRIGGRPKVGAGRNVNSKKRVS